MAENYTPHEWSIGEPITQGNMNHIEQGIAAMTNEINGKVDSESFNSLVTEVDRYKSTLTNINSVKIPDLESQIANGIADGQTALNQIKAVTNNLETNLATVLDELTVSLTSNMGNLQSAITLNREDIELLKTNVNGAKRLGDANDTLAARFGSIESTLSLQSSAINTLNNSSGDNYDTLAERLNAIDGQLRITTTLPSLTTEVTNARGVDENNEPYLTLNARLNAMDSKTLATTGVANTAIQQAKIAHNMTTSDASYVLGADQGGVITNAITTAKNEAITEAKSYADNNKVAKGSVADNLDTNTAGYVLGAGQGKILNDRLSDAETELSNAHISSVIRTNNNPTSFDSVDERLENIETIGTTVKNEVDATHRNNLGTDELTGLPIQDSLSRRFADIEAAAVASDNAIDTRIDAIDGGTTPTRTLQDVTEEVENARSSLVKGTEDEETHEITPHVYTTLDARLETIESDVNSIAGELAMLDGTSIKDTNTKIDNLEADIQSFASELAMGRDQNGRLVEANTRIDDITDEINAAHRPVEQGEPEDTLDHRFDDIEAGIAANQNAISHPISDDPENPDIGGLTEQLATTNSNIDAINIKIGGNYTAQNTVTDAIAAAEAAAEAYADDNKIDKSAIYNSLDRLAPNTVLDARQGKILDDRLNDLNTYTLGLATNVATAQAIAESAPFFIKDMQDRVDATNATVAQISTTIVLTKSEVNFNQDNVPTTLKNGEIHDKDDYLIQSPANDKYYYWKHINNEWHLMGGAGSEGGNTSGFDLTRTEYNAIVTKTENTDYYVIDTIDDGNNESHREIRHYRWTPINGVLTEIEIDNFVRRYNMNKTYDETEQKYYLNLYEYGYNEAFDDTTASRIAQIELPQGGGGSGSASVTRVVRVTPSTVNTVLNENRIYLRYFYSSVDTTGETHEGTYTLKYNNASIIAQGTIVSGASDTVVSTGVWPAAPRPIGYQEIDITDYCRLGTQTFNLAINADGSTINRTWTINIIELRLTSDATESAMIAVGNTIALPYTPYGALEKTLHVEVDGTQIDTVTLGPATSGSELEYTVPAQAHGAHTISIYLTALLEGVETATERITRDYIWYDAENEQDTIILASPYRYAALDTLTTWSTWTANTAYAVGAKVKITSGSTTIGYICKTANNDASFDSEKWIAQAITAEQYSEVEIPYTIYNKESNNYSVEYYYDYVDGQDNSSRLIGSVTLNKTNNSILRYVVNDFGNHTLTIKVGDITATFNLIISKLNIDVSLVPGAVINFDPSTLTNNSTNRLPTWTYNNETYHMTVSDNFNWSDDASGGGYKEDDDGKCFVIKAGTYAEFDYKMFKQVVDTTDPENPVFKNSVFERGAEMKVTFKVTAVRDASAVWFTNVGQPTAENNMPIGIQLSAHQGWLKTSAADAAERQAQETGESASTNAYLYFPYSEEDKIELDININKSGRNEDFIMSYEDGVPSKAYGYETDEIVYHTAGNESVIRIGSPDCDVHIYKFRIYDKALTTSEILRNFIGDGKTINEKVSRYDRNSIYYDSTKDEGQRFTPYKTGSAKLDPEQLAKKMPNVKILMLECPTFTKSKKTFVKSSLRCIHEEGGEYYPARPNEDNWLFQGGYHSGQGTTSDNYGQSSRNVDFLFICDGTHAPTKKKNITGYEGYVSSLIKGADQSVFNPTTKSWEPAVGATETVCVDWKDGDNWKASTEYTANTLIRYNGNVYKCALAHTSESTFDSSKWTLMPGYTNKVSLTPTSVPNNYFNLKVNVASSENVNNALFQKRFNDYLSYVYQSPAYKRDQKIKNDMEFVPAVLFLRETDTTQDANGNYTNHLEFNDTEWHFYSLGNIGDSKKTDYTRAYDPDDMNEFTVEISDNNTHNSQFQSGVYINNGQRVVEESDSGINSMNYIWDITDEEWNAQRDPTEFELDHDYRVANGIKKYDDDTDVQDEFPYILSNGKVYVNYRHRMLSAEPFDGKHSFEFRYACCGDYRDGDLINKTSGQDDDAQEVLNRAVVEAFYEWIITASNEEFKSQLAEWCVPEAVEYFYAFTHFYTMMDNRAKNCFWHFAKTGTHRQVHHTSSALLHVYDELINGEYVRTEDTEIDPEKTYYTEYAFDLWAYDMDTAAGIDNNGELIFPYGKEDTDYRVAGVPSSGYVFNGAGSIIWRRVSTSFTDKIADIFNRVNEAACFDAAHLINEFDTFQNCYPEEMWRLDIERKYIRTFTGKVYDNCKLTDTDGVTKQNTRFLKEMMQGRKKYQRRQWVRDQAIYFGSKYMLNNVRSNTIEMVCYTPDFPLWTARMPYSIGDYIMYDSKLYYCKTANNDATFTAEKWIEGVTPDYHLKITPYQDMYINVAVGNGNLRTPTRAIAGQEYTIDCTANMNETRIYIYAGSYIQALSNLAPFYIGANIFSSAAHLKKLDLGTDNTTYHNTNLKGLTILPNMPILEELNIKNCDSLSTPINLSESNNLRIVEAEGSIIPSLSLPAYTKIETLHLPSSVNMISLQSAQNLTSFYMKNKATELEDYSNLVNINVNDSDYSSNINWMTIASSCLNHINTLYLQDLRTSSIADIGILQSFLDRKNAIETSYDTNGNLINKLNLSGTIHIDGDWSTIEKTTYENVWPNLTLDVDENYEVIRYRVVFKLPSDVDGGRELYSVYLTPSPGSTTVSLGSDPVYTNVIAQPSKASTVSTEYIFGDRNSYGYIAWTGWRKSTSANPVRNDTNIDGDTVLIAVFNQKTRAYPIQWYLKEGDSTPVKTSEAVYYGSNYEGLEPTVYDLKEANQSTSTIRISGSNCNYSIFKGWQKIPMNLDSTFLNNAQTAFCIYGDWETGTSIPVSTILNDAELTPRKLLLLSVYNDNLDLGSDLIEVNDTLDLTLGHDSIEAGTLLIGEGSTYIMNDSRTYNPTVSFSAVNNPPAFSSNITPFSSNDGFTIAIDYRFNTDAIKSNWAAGFSVLAGCHEKIDNSTAQGFSLYYDIAEETPKVSFGNQSVLQTFNTSTYSCAIGDYTNADMRNIIVLRHPANSNVIQIYSGIYPSSNILPSIDDAFFVQEITWSANTSAAKLCFGHLVPDGTTAPLAQLRAGLGTIYWAKYWNKDLGKSECTRLASWIHEKMRFAVEEYPNADQKILNTSSKNIIFNALQVSQYGGPSFRANSRGNTIGEIQSWVGSLYKDISNKRFFLGLPTTIQSIINKTEGKASAVICEQGQYNGKYSYYTDYDTVDYSFLPAYAEVTGSTGAYYEGEALRGMPWFSAGNTKVISYVNTSFNFNNPTTSVEYMNLRFPGVPINLGASANTVYINYAGTDPVYGKIGSTRIKRGDIFIYQNVAYIYASDEDIRNGAPIINTDTGVFACTEGGWVRGRPWWTRSVLEMDPANNTNSFYFINNQTGNYSTGLPSDEGRTGCWFSYSFGI